MRSPGKGAKPSKKQEYVRGFALRSVWATAGLMVFACGVYLVIQANLGAAPWDVLNLGLVKRTGIIYGNIAIIISAVIFAIDIFIFKEKVGWGTVLDALVVGKTVDLLNWINVLPAMEGSVPSRVAVMLSGFLLEAFGQFLYMRQGLSFGPRDTLLVGLNKKLSGISIGLTNVMLLAVVLGGGWLLGGPVGIASVLAPFGIGWAQDLLFKLVKFEPRAVINESLIDTWAYMRGKKAPPDFFE